MAEIKQSINKIQVIGTLKEMNLEEISADVTLGKGTSNEKKVKCQQIAKKEFKNPMFLVESKGMDIGVDFFSVSEKKLDDNGKVIDNPRFKSMQTVLNTYVPKNKCNTTEQPTRVKIDCSLRANEYANKNKEFIWTSFQVVNGFQITSSNVPEDDIADGEISGIISKIVPEILIKNDTEEETGRLKVEMYTFDNNGLTTPFNFFVEQDLSEIFQETYEAGTSCKLDYEVIIKQAGGKKSGISAFKRRETEMVSGFDIPEYSVFGGDTPFDEESGYYIDNEDMKKALNERNIMIENKIKEAKEKDDSPKPQGLKGRGVISIDENNKNSSSKKSSSPFG